jgi:threonine/homoserine/homoserine lactone efflux protein
VDSVTAIAPFAIAGSILPTWTIAVIALLGTARPVANATAFILGNASVRTLIGLAILFVVPLPASESFRLDSGAWDARLVVVIGIVLLVFAVWIWTRSPAEESGSWIDRADQIRPLTAFIAGAAMTASPGVQYAYLLGGLAVVLETTNGALAQVTALLLFVLALQWMLALPVVIYLLFRRGSTRVLLRMKEWLRDHGRRLVAGILGVAGSYVIVSGMRQLLG